MDGYGLADRFQKGAIRAVVGVVLTGALIGGGIVYLASHNGNNNQPSPTPTQTQKAPTLK